MSILNNQRIKSILRPCVYFFRSYYPTLWTDGHVKRLVHNNYKPKQKINKIAFVDHSMHTLFHYENIFRFLGKDEFDIISITRYPGEKCKTKEISEYAQKNNYNILSINEVFKKKLQYKVAIAIFPNIAGCAYKNNKMITGLELLAEKNVKAAWKIGSGIGIGHGDPPYNHILNYIFCSGNYNKALFESLALKAKIIVTGPPRFDKIINTRKGVNKQDLYRKLNLDSEKKTILYLPGNLSIRNIIEFIPMFAQIQDMFNIIIKPHPMSMLYAKNGYLNIINNIISKAPSIKILNTTDNLELFPISDYIICDYGGSIFNAINDDKNVMFFNTLKYSKDLLYAYGHTPEIELRSRIINFDNYQEKEFLESLNNEQIWEQQKEIRKQLRAEFYTENENAAQDIANLLRQIVIGKF